MPGRFLSRLAGAQEYEVLKVVPSVGGTPYFNVAGHWLARTGSGHEFTLDLITTYSSVTGQMTRAGVTGVLQGSVDQEDARFYFAVTWPDASALSGSASAFDNGELKRGELAEAGGTDTFSASRQ
ncbi:MAG: hypothetical protein NTY53_13600 [Kiritimatiellaeota bacterium]|nr:hypothetical protein [Kiritimatiellota bacterium]